MSEVTIPAIRDRPFRAQHCHQRSLGLEPLYGHKVEGLHRYEIISYLNEKIVEYFGIIIRSSISFHMLSHSHIIDYSHDARRR